MNTSCLVFSDFQLCPLTACPRSRQGYFCSPQVTPSTSSPLAPQSPMAPQPTLDPQTPTSPVFRRRRPRLTSPDMFADSSYESPYAASQGGAGYATQLAFALSVSEVSAVILVQ